jgi:hypothetical protein
VIASASGLQRHPIPNRLHWEVEALIGSALALAEADAHRWFGAPPRAAPLDPAALLARFGSATEHDDLAALVELESIAGA